jgi:hypothetical protein
MSHLRGLPRHHVGDDGDDAAAADRHERQRDIVVAREHGEVRAAREDDLGHLIEGPRGLLDADDARAVADEARHRVRLDVDGGAARDVVDDDRDVHRLGHGPEVAVQSLLGRPVVVRVHHERGRRARLLGMRGEIDGLGGRVRAGARDDRQAPSRRVDHDLDHPLVLVVAQGRGLAGGSAGDDAIRALRHMDVHELTQLRLVHLAVPERGDQGNDGALEHGTRHGLSSMRRCLAAIPLPRKCSDGECTDGK